MKLNRQFLRLYAVTDRRWLNGTPLSDAVEGALLGGATMVQLREKTLAEADFLAEARALLPLCRRFGAPLIINDNVRVAIESGADGVHVGQSDLELSRARELLGPDKIIGVSAHSVAEAQAAERGGADYLGVGAVFPTGTKTDTRPLTHADLRAITSCVRIPAVAIGGIGADNVPQLDGAGFAGAAVVSALFAAPSVENAARRLRALCDRHFA